LARGFSSQSWSPVAPGIMSSEAKHHGGVHVERIYGIWHDGQNAYTSDFLFHFYSIQVLNLVDGATHIQGGLSPLVNPLWKHLHRPDRGVLF
jgi:hypothetical protein